MHRILSLIKRPQLEAHTLLLFFLTVAFLVNSMALYHKEHYPTVISYNAATNIAQLVRASRDEEALRDLFLGGFRNATAIATGSWPFEPAQQGRTKVKPRIMSQIFSDEATASIQRIRETIAVHQTYWTCELSFNSPNPKDIKVLTHQGGIYFESFFNQSVPTGENEKRIRTFHVRAFGHVAPATQDNPYNIKLTEFQIREIQPKMPRN